MLSAWLFKFVELVSLEELVQQMTRTRPEDRTDAPQALDVWEKLHASMPRERLRPTIPVDEEGSIERIVNNALIMVEKVHRIFTD
ncbi:hypothetical protein JVT61DRAFT_4575 [Boletus reticuloceps]|uniref:Uncharacterized protein n=1 Tax=Boletus reticuloceps TaxID=495285 RepID=A0A8I2YP59_9AGAM|nr:hypothetical protein JVT61DRAFT_4575 [Boletus reticuloceps]